MARLGAFGDDQTPRGWFGDDASAAGWFDEDLTPAAAAPTISAESASYAMVGFAVALKKTSLVLAASGSFALSGGAGGGPAWDKGFNFRQTSGFVTDGTDETYDLGAVYPVTRNGVTFGWDTDLTGNARDRVNTNDRRLAGINFKSNDGTQRIFRVDLPAAGDYTIRLAMGDPNTDQAYQYVQIRDGAAALFTVDDTDGWTNGTWDDATGANYTNATWPGSNTAVTASFTGTALNLALASPTAQTALSMIAHLFVSKVDTGVAWTNLKVGRKVQGGLGTFTATGQDATLTHDTGPAVIVAAHGTYTETGQSANLRTARTLLLGQGTYIKTGMAAGLKSGRRVSAGQGTYTETGIAAGLRAARRVAIGQGTFTETGIAVGLKSGRRVAAGMGSYAETGNDASLIRGGNVILAGSTGSFAQTGIAATLRAARIVQSLVGTYTETGQAATLAFGHRLLGNVGIFTLIGQAADLTFRGAAGTSSFSGSLSSAPRFSGDLGTSQRFSGVVETSSRFYGEISVSTRFSGMLVVTPLFDGELETEPS